MTAPNPTPIYRALHVDNLAVHLRRNALHAPNHTPNDGLKYRTIHNVDIQKERHARSIPCGPRGTIHDYVTFYFGPRSPMLYQLHTGWVSGYDEGQEPIIYLTSTAQGVDAQGAGFVFSDGHGIAAFTKWFDDLRYLDRVDWDAVNARIWRDTVEDPDRQRRKQAEFMVHRRLDWAAIDDIGVINAGMKTRVEAILGPFPAESRRPVLVRPAWYY